MDEMRFLIIFFILTIFYGCPLGLADEKGVSFSNSENEKIEIFYFDHRGRSVSPSSGFGIGVDFYLNISKEKYYFSKGYFFLVEIDNIKKLKRGYRWKTTQNSYRVSDCDNEGRCIIVAAPKYSLVDFSSAKKYGFIIYSKVVFSKNSGVLMVTDYGYRVDEEGAHKLFRQTSFHGEIFSVSSKKLGNDPTSKINKLPNFLFSWPKECVIDADDVPDIYYRGQESILKRCMDYLR
ncbi:MAG: hypothetical protein U5M23_07265 [Marinagarivorans sp.]|nr:hypothetical protein [Marinagarivorans sp.]